MARLKTNPLDAKKKKLFIAETVIAIEKVHNAKILHNDLSLQNILIDSDGHLMLNDFGLSQTLNSDATSAADWICLHGICDSIFTEPIDETETHFMRLFSHLEKLTDGKLNGELFEQFVTFRIEYRIQ